MNTLTLLLALASTLQTAQSSPVVTAGELSKRADKTRAGYTNTFWDDFNYPLGALAQPNSNWIVDSGTQYAGGEPMWGNNEVQTYRGVIGNLEVISGGYLKITPRKDTAGKWTSARVETRRTDFVAKAGGKLLVEIRVKLGSNPASSQQGIWPAFWALGSEFRGNYHNWPLVTEWDILEVINGQTKLYSTLHCGVAPGGPCNEYTGLSSGGANTFTRGVFHTLGFVVDRKGKSSWRDEAITWTLDGKQIYQIKGSVVNNQDAWTRLAQKSHFLLLNVAIGGNFAGPPNAKTLAGPESGMVVDWVGVWNA